MDLTPIDLKKQEFKRVMRGYDPDQVDGLLHQVAVAWEDLIRSRTAADQRIDELASTVENYRRMERTLNDTLLVAQRIAEESREATLREAEIVRKEAEMEGRRVVDRARSEARHLEEQIGELRAAREKLFLNLRTLMEEELLRLHALHERYGELTAHAAAEASLSPPAAERRPVVPPSPGVSDLLKRPVGLRQATRERSDPPAGREEPSTRLTHTPEAP